MGKDKINQVTKFQLEDVVPDTKEGAKNTPEEDIPIEEILAEEDKTIVRDPRIFDRTASLLPMDVMDADQVRIVGVGGIGRQVALQATAVGIGSIVLYDDDDISITNVSTQGYPYEDIELPKIRSLLYSMEEINPFSFYLGYEDKFPLEENLIVLDGDRESGAIFCCVDQIAARTDIFDRLVSEYIACPLLIDGRMAAETGRVITVCLDNVDDVAYYRSTLFPPHEQEPEPCTAKATIYCGNFIAALMIKQYTRWVQGVLKPNDKYRDMMFSLKTLDIFPFEPPIDKKKPAIKKQNKAQTKKKGGGKDKNGVK